MNKLMMVDDVEFEERLLCHHVESESCYNVHLTRYVPRRVRDCEDSFRKDCYIESEQVSVPVAVTVCEQERVERTCGEAERKRRNSNAIAGREICSVEFVSGKLAALFNTLEPDLRTCTHASRVILKNPFQYAGRR